MSQRLTPSGYRPRHIDEPLQWMLRAFGAVELTGPKWCGKTWSALNAAEASVSLLEPATAARAEVDPALLLEGPYPKLIDEWQENPAIWDATRYFVDTHPEKGRIILTGSARPKDPSAVKHSGAGRIARLKMGPMTLSEQYPRYGGVSVAGLFAGEFNPTTVETTVADVASWVVRGGWPGTLEIDDESAAMTSRQYIDALLDFTFPWAGKNSVTAERLLQALAANVAQAVTLKTLSREMGAGDEVSYQTVTSYMEVLRSNYIIEELPGWGHEVRSKERLRSRPIPLFTCPSLASAILGVTPAALLQDMQTLGRLFETLVLRDMRCFQAVWKQRSSLHYYRSSRTGLEADLVISLSDGRYGIAEFKLSEQAVKDETVERLQRVAAAIHSNPYARIPEPSFVAVIVGQGAQAYRRKDGIYILPAAALEP